MGMSFIEEGCGQIGTCRQSSPGNSHGANKPVYTGNKGPHSSYKLIRDRSNWLILAETS